MRCHRVAYRFSGPVTPDLAVWIEALAGRPFASTPQWRPRADVWETADAYVVRADVPGIAEDDIRVVLHPDVLVIDGTRRVERPEGSRCHVAEIRSGPFRVAMRLPPDVDADRAESRLERGVLTVELPKLAPGRGEGRR